MDEGVDYGGRNRLTPGQSYEQRAASGVSPCTVADKASRPPFLGAMRDLR